MPTASSTSCSRDARGQGRAGRWPRPRPGLPPGPRSRLDAGPAPARPPDRPLHPHPFADPSVLRMLPTAVGDELLAAHGRPSAPAASTRSGGRPPTAAGLSELDVGSAGYLGPNPTFVSPLSIDPDRLAASAAGPGGRRGAGPHRGVGRRIRTARSSSGSTGWSCRRTCSAASGPSTSSWNASPDRRGRVVFVALAYPTRQGLPEYLAYQNEVESTVARINERWGDAGLDADRPRGRGRLPPIARGAHPLRRPAGQPGARRAQPGGQGGTARQHPTTGCSPCPARPAPSTSSAPACLEVNPFDVSGTAAVLGRGARHRSRRAGRDRPTLLVARIEARTPVRLARATSSPPLG